jgi:hypothetical protein
MSKASEVALAIDAILKTITVANGYQTDIGNTVFRGKLKIAEDDVPCVVLDEGGDKIKADASNANMPGNIKLKPVLLLQRYHVSGHTTCDTDNPNDAAHLMLEDIKRAIFGGDRTLGGAVRNIYYVGRDIGRREDGLALVAAVVAFDCEFAEDLTSP